MDKYQQKLLEYLRWYMGTSACTMQTALSETLGDLNVIAEKEGLDFLEALTAEEIQINLGPLLGRFGVESASRTIE